MAFLKNKFVIIVIVAIVAGGVLGLYLANGNTQKTPTYVASGSGMDTQKVGEVIKKLDDLSEK